MKSIIKRILSEETNKKKLDNSFYDKIEAKKSKNKHTILQIQNNT